MKSMVHHIFSHTQKQENTEDPQVTDYIYNNIFKLKDEIKRSY